MVMSNMKIVVASGNKGKIREIKQILEGYDIVTMKEIGFTEEPVEDGETFEENALIKAKAVYDFCHLPCLADDSGLCVTALDNRPGVYSARYSGGDDEDNNDLLLKELSDKTDRSAKYCCAIVLYAGEDKVFTAYGEATGHILTERQGANGFGYDPLFYSDDLGMSFGVADAQTKHTVSHRARALKDLYAQIKDKEL